MNNNEIKIEEDLIKIPKIKNPWIIATIVLAIICLFLFYNSYNLTSSESSTTLSGEEAGEKIVNYLNSRVAEGEVQYVSYKDLGSLYEITVSHQGNILPVFVTKDGEFFVQAAIPITDTNPLPLNNQQLTNIQINDNSPLENSNNITT